MESNKIDELAAKVMTLAQNTATVNLRFLQSAISVLKQEKYDGKITTNGRMLYYDPIYILRAYKTNKCYPERWYLHILFHCVFRHWFVTERINTELWDLACDIAVESIINELGVSAILQQAEQIKAAEQLRERTGFLTAEKLYDFFLNNHISANEMEKLQKLFSFDEHAIWYMRNMGNALGNSQSENSDLNGNLYSNTTTGSSTLLAAEWQEISERMQTDLETFSKKRGNNAGTLVQNLAAVNREKYDYSAFLKKFAVMREIMRVNDDEFDYIFYTYGLNMYKNMPLIEPLETREVRKIEDFVIAIDTSMSTSGELVRAFLSRTYELLQENTSFFRHFNLRILQCDDQLRSDKKVTNARELAEYMEHFELIGQSATDFRPVFEHVDRLNAEGAFRHLRGLLYFTDGLGIYPKKRPKYDAAFVMLEGEAYPDKVPSWGIRAVISEDALSVE